MPLQKTQKFIVIGDGKPFTTYDVIDTKYNGSTYLFIDTPGLNDAKWDKDNNKQIKQAILDYPELGVF